MIAIIAIIATSRLPPAMEQTPVPARYRPKRYGLFVVFIAIIGAFSSLVNDMYLPTIPAMMREFHTTPSMTQMGLSMAMLGMGIGSVLWGSLSDHFGRKPILIISLLIFAVSTGVALLSPDITFFVAVRLVQGFGAGGAMVLSTSIPADVFAGRQLGKLMGIVGAINGIAPAAGPLLGGFLANRVGWQGIFVVLLAIGIGMTIWTTLTNETLPPARRIAARRLSDYLKSYRTMLLNGRFMIYVVIKALGIALLYAYISSGPFIIQDHYHFSALTFGIIFGANALAIAAGAMLAPRFRIMKQAMVVGTVGMFLLSLGMAAVMWYELPFWAYELVAVPLVLCLGMIFSSANTLAMDVGRADAGTSSAILGVVKYILAAIVSPLCGLGNLMHSSAIVVIVTAAIALLFAFLAYRLSPLSDMVKH